MTRILRYIAVVATVCVGLAGCDGSHEVDARLAQVNDLANAGEADSAIALLQSIEKTSLNEYNSRYHDLMDIKTRDKADADITGDTAIVDIMEYFDDEGPDEVRGEAYYYGGRVYREMGDAPQALDYYQKAQDAYPQDQAFMKGKIASQMGQLFLELYMFDHAKTKFQEAIHHQKECNNLIGRILDLRALGDIYRKLEMNDSALNCFKQALYLNSNSKSHLKREVDIRSSIIDLYISQNEYDKARNEFEEFDELSSNFGYDYVLCTKINMYIVNKNYTKAISIAHQLKQSQSLRSRIFAYSVLLDYSKLLNKNNSVYHYANEHKKCVDSLNLQASANAVIHQNSFYNYSIREKQLFLIEKKQLKTQILLLLTLVIILIFSYFYVKIRKQNIFLQDTNKKLTISNDKLNDELSKRIHRVECLEKEVNNLNNRIVDEYSAISRLSEQVRSGILKKMQEVTTKETVVSENIVSSDVYNRLKRLTKEKDKVVTDDCWNELDNLINIEYANFKKRIQILYPKLNELEYRLCMLVKCQFSINDCAFLINRERSSVPKMRKRLYEKLFNKEGLPSDFDKFISLL